MADATTRIRQCKTGRLLWLSLTDEVAAALLDYLRHGRPQLAVGRYRRGFQTDRPQHREIILRCITPAGVLKPTAITEAFQAWSRRAASYALHLLRSGLSSEDDRRSTRAPQFRKHVHLSSIGDRGPPRCAIVTAGERVHRDREGDRTMKAATPLTPLLAPHVERYVTLKQALGRKYDGVRRVLAHVDHFVTMSVLRRRARHGERDMKTKFSSMFSARMNTLPKPSVLIMTPPPGNSPRYQSNEGSPVAVAMTNST
jgi:hypothetical protein